MQKCVTENCTWLKKYGKCADECRSRGFSKVVTNYDQLKDMDIEDMATAIAKLILSTDKTAKSYIQYMCARMELFDFCIRWLNEEVNDER